MPTYEYECTKCKGTFEMFQSMKDDALSVCPKERCLQKRWGKGKIKRLLGTGAGLIFKGSGFYITDYRSEGYKQAAKSETESSKPKTEASSSGSSSSSAGSTTAPAAKPAEKKPAKAKD